MPEIFQPGWRSAVGGLPRRPAEARFRPGGKLPGSSKTKGSSENFSGYFQL